MANSKKLKIATALDQALRDHAAGQTDQAHHKFLSILDLDPKNIVALYMMGAVSADKGQYQEALIYLNQTISLNEQFAQSYLARSVVYSKMGKYSLAFKDIQNALKLDPNIEGAQKNYETLRLLSVYSENPTMAHQTPSKMNLLDLIEKTNQVTSPSQIEETIRDFQNFLTYCEESQAHLALFSLGVLHHKLTRNYAAEAYFRHSLFLKNDFFACHLNLGLLLERNNRPASAITQWEQALKIDSINLPDNLEDKLKITTNLGRLLEVQHDYEKAENALREALSIDPDNSPVLHHWVHLRQKQCRWPIAEGLNRPEKDVLANASPIAMLGLSDDPAAQLAAGRHFVETKVETHPRMVPFKFHYGNERLKIGYLSSNLSMHAVSLLTVELFECHDRNKFEIHAFCWSPEDGTPFRQRVKSGFDHFHTVGALTDEQVAELIKSNKIDVLVDLQGLTSGARPNIVARGPAPIQIAYLGYPGPSALPYIDYVVADSFIMPPELCPHFTEKPLYLPSLFQVSDRKRQISATPPRSQFGFHEDDFVFCAFNNNHKFTPELFGVWMRILRATPNSLLWLLEDNQWSKANLIAAAAAHGVPKQRLHFAGRIIPSEYLARFAVADLFLDTMPYNAGTTANDALWAGLPLLTLSGKTYASRMAGSLLNSIGLSELITFDMEQYEKTAIRLATNPHEIKDLRQKLSHAKDQGTLFNTDTFTREFETSLLAVFQERS